MPELPDIELYLHALRPRVLGRAVEGVRVVCPFLLRSVEPAVEAMEDKRVESLRRLGKRIVIGLEGELFCVLHLMIAGRLRWLARGAKGPGRIVRAAFDFESGTLALTEAGSKKRAAMHLVQGEAALAAHDPGGIEVLDADVDAFAMRLRSENHTLKRALTDPHLFAGIGNAYSDEILHSAGLSPVTLTSKLSDEEIERLFAATQRVLREWSERLTAQFGDRFPGAGDVTAFRPEFAVHGKFGQPCPACGTTVQRIRYAENETNYCPRCQTGGRVLADRSLSRLLKSEWPRTVDELEAGAS
jgi:formamidopyrimidine-DNA glycosylase